MMIVFRLVYGSYEWQICTQLLHFLTAVGYYRKWWCFNDDCIKACIWVVQVANLYAVVKFFDSCRYYILLDHWWRFLYLHYLLPWRRCSILKYIFHDLCTDCISQTIYFMLHCRLWIFLHICTMISFGGFLAECLPCFP